jgi:hypothetical protein|nr:MAG TPA: hypothetical protein [Caudoviricetes sp.]
MKFEPKKLKFVHEFPDDREWLDEERLKAKLVYYDGVMIASISYDSDARLFNLWFEDFKYKYPKNDKENSVKPEEMQKENNHCFETLKICKEVISEVLTKFLPQVEYIRPTFEENESSLDL